MCSSCRRAVTCKMSKCLCATKSTIVVAMYEVHYWDVYICAPVVVSLSAYP